LDLEALWRSVIEVKYVSMRGGWCSTEIAGTYGVSLWKHIRRGGDNFSNFVHFEVGVCYALMLGVKNPSKPDANHSGG
jgi:hypothetical protein